MIPKSPFFISSFFLSFARCHCFLFGKRIHFLSAFTRKHPTEKKLLSFAGSFRDLVRNNKRVSSKCQMKFLFFSAKLRTGSRGEARTKSEASPGRNLTIRISWNISICRSLKKCVLPGDGRGQNPVSRTACSDISQNAVSTGPGARCPNSSFLNRRNRKIRDSDFRVMTDD